MSETLINWPDACVFCGDSNGTIGRTANDHWKQFKCGTEYEVVGEKTAWIQDDDCKIAALMEELAAEKQQRQAAEEETKRWMELAEHQAIGRDKLGTDLAAATKRAEEAEADLHRAVIEWTAKLDESEDRWAAAEKARDAYNDMRVIALEEVAGCRDRIKEYREKVEQLETDKANYHDKWLNALEKLKDADQENARLREGIQDILKWSSLNAAWTENKELRSEIELWRKAWTDARDGLLAMKEDNESNLFATPRELLDCCIELMDSIATVDKEPATPGEK